MKDTYAIYQYLFSTYERRQIYAKDEILDAVSLRYGTEKQVNVQVKEDVYALVKQDDPDVSTTIEQSIQTAPVSIEEPI